MKHITTTFMTAFVLAITMMQTLSAQETLPVLTYSDSPANFNGKIKKYDAAKGDITVSYKAGMATETKELKVAVNADGTFSAQVPVVYTKFVTLAFDTLTCDFLLTPGETLVLTIDPSKAGKKKGLYKFEGLNADFNNDYAIHGQEFSAGKVFATINGEGLKNLKGLDIPGYKAKLMELYNAGIAELDKQKVGNVFKSFVKTNYQVQTLGMMTGYAPILAYANGKKQEDYQNVPADYWNEAATWAPFSSNNILYSQYSSDLQGYAMSITRFADGVSFQLPESYGQIAKAKEYKKVLTSMKPLDDAQISSLKSECPQLCQSIIDDSEALKKTLEESKKEGKFAVKELDEKLTGADVFKALVAPYKGKMLLVDFWATWCGPCKRAMQTILPVKEELWGRVNFIYVTGPSSPKDTWSNLIPTIHGDHYYVTQEQYDTLLNQFESQGIPTYVIVDKEGNVVNKHIGYPGNDVIKSELDK